MDHPGKDVLEIQEIQGAAFFSTAMRFGILDYVFFFLVL